MAKSQRPIHPFPARMAPEIALDACSKLEPGSVVLDPMTGSGTVLRAAQSFGHKAIGVDLDPLSVLMSRVWTTSVAERDVLDWGDRLCQRVLDSRISDSRLPWIDDDPETSDFVEYWFGRKQSLALRKIAYRLRRIQGPVSDALRIALSRTIVSKEAGVSLARDTSHSRPHRVMESSDVDVLSRFHQSYRWLARRLAEEPLQGEGVVHLGDARDLHFIKRNSVDAVISSPPYLNAIDYLRGHKLALVWFGYTCSQIREIGRDATGTERGREVNPELLGDVAAQMFKAVQKLQPRFQTIVGRYITDMREAMSEIRRVVKPGGLVVMVVGNSSLRGVFLRNDALLANLAESCSFDVVDVKKRRLPANRRYLPPPSKEASTLGSRMRTESVITLKA